MARGKGRGAGAFSKRFPPPLQRARQIHGRAGWLCVCVWLCTPDMAMWVGSFLVPCPFCWVKLGSGPRWVIIHFATIYGKLSARTLCADLGPGMGLAGGSEFPWPSRCPFGHQPPGGCCRLAEVKPLPSRAKQFRLHYFFICTREGRAAPSRNPSPAGFACRPLPSGFGDSGELPPPP